MDIKRFYVSPELFDGDMIRIEGGEFNHLTRVLRHKVGYKIIVCNDADGIDYYAEITEINRDFVIAKVYDKQDNECKTNVEVTLYQALPKGDKIDLITQKAVELGVGNIVVFDSEYVSENKFNLDRLDKINVEACKQCGRSRVAKIRGKLAFDEMITELSRYDKVIVCYENEQINTFRSQLEGAKINNLALIIGSEGGFAEKEIEQIKSAGGVSVTLGSRILRAETASIVSIGLAMYELGEMVRK